MWIIFDGNVSVDLDKIDKIVIKDGEKGKRICFQKVSSGHLATVHEVTVETVSLEELKKNQPDMGWNNLDEDVKTTLQKKLIEGAEKDVYGILFNMSGVFDPIEFSMVLEIANKYYLFSEGNEVNEEPLPFFPKQLLVNGKDIALKVLQVVEGIKKGVNKPIDLSSVATEFFAKIGLENMSDELVDLLHDCFDYSNTPTGDGLKIIEEKARRVLNGDLL